MAPEQNHNQTNQQEPTQKNPVNIFLLITSLVFFVIIIALILLAAFLLSQQTENNANNSQAQQTKSTSQQNNQQSSITKSSKSSENYPQLQIQTRTFAKETNTYKIDATYPEIVNYPKQAIQININKQMENYAKSYENSMQETVNVMGPPPQGEAKYSVTSNFDYYQPNNKLFSVHFSGNEDNGGAHPVTKEVTYNYNLADAGRELTIHDLFKKNVNGLQLVANYTKQELKSRDYTLDSQVDSGAAANTDNYQTFYLTTDHIVIVFPPYQVAPYAAGTPTVEIPYTEFSGKLNPELELF